MTVTIVFGKTTDGYLYSYDANQTNSRNGPADGVTGGTAMYIGRNNNDAQYATFLGYVGYDYPAIPAADTVTAAAVRLWVLNLLSPTYAQDIVWRGFTWSASGLQVADWRNPTQIAALRNDGLVHILSAASDKYVQASSDELLTAMRTVTSMEHLVHTNQTLAGAAPTRDEAIALSSADEAGTAFDPQLVYTSVTRNSLFGVLGAQVALSDGWAWLESNGAATPTITLKYRPFGSATVTTIGTIPIGTAVNQFAVPAGYQALSLAADPSGNLLVMGCYSQAENSLAMLAYKRGSGVTWTVQPMRSSTLPTYGAAINQVVSVWHPYGAGSVVAFIGHVGSAGDSVVHNETMHCIIDIVPLINNTGNGVRGSGYSLPALGYVAPPSQYFNAWHNETGNGMDVASPAIYGGSADQAYFYSMGGNQNLGDNRKLYEGWYILNPASSGFQWTKTVETSPYGRKDAAGKVRVVPVSSQAAAFIATDSDVGWGITVQVRNHTGTDSTSIGYRALAGEDINAFPDGNVVAQTSAWDAVYNEIENRLWIYYVSTADAGIVRRTSFDLNTMQPTLQSVVVYDDAGAGTVQAIRVQRNKGVGQTTLVTIAISTAGALSTQYVVDAFNIAPTAPTLTTKANFDAATAQTFAWTFNDPNGDPQYAYQLEISNVATGVVALDTGKVVSATPSRNVAGSTIPNSADYRWRVKAWDPSDVESPWSAYGTFTASAGGTVTITSPATDNPLNVITDDLPITWSVSGTTQAAYRVWLYRGTTLVSDTNWIASTATTATVAGMLSDQAHEIRVQVRNGAAVVTNTAVRLLTPSYSTPEVPVLSVTPQAEDGYVLISIDNPTPGAPALGIPEDGFEGGIGTWQTGTGSTVGVSADAHRGTGSLILTATTGGVDPIYTRDWGNFRPVTPGLRYTARMWVKVSAQTNVSGTIDWQSATYAYMSSSSFNQVVPANEWTQIQVTGTAPAGAAFCAYGPSMTGGVPTGRTLVLDEVTLGTASDRPETATNQILRRYAGTDDPFEVIGTAGPDGDFRDYTATAGINYEYVVRGNS
jgi:hypothetical protein